MAVLPAIRRFEAPGLGDFQIVRPDVPDVVA
jgi:hypothetical protein